MILYMKKPLSQLLKVAVIMTFLPTPSLAQVMSDKATPATPLIMTCFTANIRVDPTDALGKYWDKVRLSSKHRHSDIVLVVNGLKIGSVTWNSLTATYRFSVTSKQKLEIVIKDKDAIRYQIIGKATVPTSPESQTFQAGQAEVTLKKVACS